MRSEPTTTPASRRIDVGGPDGLLPYVRAARAHVERSHPGIEVAVDDSAYGRTAWGLCLGSSEAAALDDRAGWGIEVCEKSGVRIISLPIARDTWLATSDHAIARPEVAQYVEQTLRLAPATARRIGAQPLPPDELARTQQLWRRFLADTSAAGTEPTVG